MRKEFDILNDEIKQLIVTRYAKPNQTVYEHTERLLEMLDRLIELGYIYDTDLIDNIQKAIIYHDLGKLNVKFNERVRSNKKFNDKEEIAHNILSLYFIDKAKFTNEQDWINVAYAVLHHHYYCDNLYVINDSKKHGLIMKLLSEFTLPKFDQRIVNKIATINDQQVPIKIKGYLHKCDYAASGGNLVEYPNNFLTKSLERQLNKWKEYNKDANWNELQRFCRNNSKRNIIAIAQTGMGKTEAGLLWIGDTKGFFVLPLRTAINAIYDRIKSDDMVGKGNIEQKVSILHSSAIEHYVSSLNSNNEIESEEIDIIKYDKDGKQLSIPLNIATMDALFDFVYKYPGYELKLTTFSYSKIVIDEIQAYAPDLLAYLIYGLERITDLGGKVAIVTATLPPFIKDKLSFIEAEDIFIDDDVRHSVNVRDTMINSDDIVEKYLYNKQNNKSNKILVVCNTIKEAQRLYKELQSNEAIVPNELHILHSKFIRKDREEREEQIIEFGRTYKLGTKEIYNANGIWISTSIVEASLDIDFDYLFTELLDLNSLFQRFGRCNRKGVKPIEDYNCYVYTQINDKLFINGDKGFIDATLFDLSREAISDYDGPITEKDKIEMINEWLTTDNLEDSDYEKTYEEVYEYIKELEPYKFNKKDVDLRNIDSMDIIPGPIYDNYSGAIMQIIDKIKEIRNELSTTRDEKKKKQLLLNREMNINELSKYTVSIHPSNFESYKRACRKGLAVKYPPLEVTKYKKIEIMDCNYAEYGYEMKDFENNSCAGQIW